MISNKLMMFWILMELEEGKIDAVEAYHKLSSLFENTEGVSDAQSESSVYADVSLRNDDR